LLKGCEEKTVLENEKRGEKGEDLEVPNLFSKTGKKKKRSR